MVEQRLPRLPCPECLSDGWGGGARIGNRRRSCTTCNNFAANVSRITRNKMKEKFPAEFAVLRLEVEHELYAMLLKEWTSEPELPDELKD